MHERDLDPRIEILAGTDVDAAWERFEIFEALHHDVEICNPLRSSQIDEAIEVVAVEAGALALDFACGSGEFLVRMHEAGRERDIDFRGIGIDLSPWMVRRAAQASSLRVPTADQRWVLGEARDFGLELPADVCVCVGAEWVWHDFSGTARALASRLRPGGVAVIGAARLHSAADPEQIGRTHGRIETVDDMARHLSLHRFEPLHRIDADDDGWDAYLERTRSAVLRWADVHPGGRADAWRREQHEWSLARERDRGVIGWSVWIARSGRASQ